EYICLGGEAMTGIPQTEVRIYNTYGPTEFTVDASYHEIDRERMYDTIPIGRPLDNCAAYIMDDCMRLLPAGMTGELCLSGPQIAQGYWKRPELTAEKFCESGDIPGIRVYRTGDLARYNERGELEYLGRIDTQVKLRGFRIELGEIENRAVRYAGIREACAEVRQEQLVLYYTLQEKIQSALSEEGKASPDNTLQMKAGSAEAEGMDSGEENANAFREGLRTFLSEQLADYMVPTVYMELETMPLNTSGKIDRKALPEPELADMGEIIPPETEKEKVLFEIAAGILGTETFGVTTNLVALGLSSIGAMRLAAEAAQRLGVRIGTAEILKSPAIRAIAEAAAEERAEESTLRPREKQEYYPITENQRGILVDWQMNQGTTQYNVPDVCPFENTEGEALAEAVRQAVYAHPALSTRFVYRDGDIMQKRNDEETPEVSVTALDRKPDKAFFLNRVQPFDLMEDRLYRLEVYTFGKDAWLFMDMHHTVFDGISGMIFLEDIRKALAGESVMPETVTAWDYALYEKEQLEGESFSEMEKRFDALMEGAETAVLPAEGHPDGKPEGVVMLRMEAKRINAFCEKCGVTPGSYMQAAFAETVRRISREDKILYTTISSGRSAGPALMRTVGMFVRTLPVVSVGTKGQSTEEYVREMHAQLVESFGQEIYPYTRLVERHRIKAEMMFAYQGGLEDDESTENDRHNTEKSLAYPGGSEDDGANAEVDSASEELLDAVKLPVSVDVWPEGDSYVLSVEYNGMRYGKREMLRFAEAVRALSESLAASEMVKDASLADDREKKHVLQLSRGDELPYDAEETWIDLFRKQVEKAPEHPAVTDRDSSYTYAELDAASDRIAEWLIRNGVKPDTFVAIRMGRVKEFIAAEMGIHKAGLGYVPIDPEYPEERIAFMLEDSEAGLTLTEEKVREILEGSVDEGIVEASVPEETVADRKSNASTAAVWEGKSLATPDSP
ncbi:MAG: AMP-binding protein, partial [Lachnospiraceae bacterium]|nr:AMP-binding protein [Lachnospiraceae bacterium]